MPTPVENNDPCRRETPSENQTNNHPTCHPVEDPEQSRRDQSERGTSERSGGIPQANILTSEPDGTTPAIKQTRNETTKKLRPITEQQEIALKQYSERIRGLVDTTSMSSSETIRLLDGERAHFETIWPGVTQKLNIQEALQSIMLYRLDVDNNFLLARFLGNTLGVDLNVPKLAERVDFIAGNLKSRRTGISQEVLQALRLFGLSPEHPEVQEAIIFKTATMIEECVEADMQVTEFHEGTKSSPIEEKTKKSTAALFPSAQQQAALNSVSKIRQTANKIEEEAKKQPNRPPWKNETTAIKICKAETDTWGIPHIAKKGALRAITHLMLSATGIYQQPFIQATKNIQAHFHLSDQEVQQSTALAIQTLTAAELENAHRRFETMDSLPPTLKDALGPKKENIQSSDFYKQLLACKQAGIITDQQAQKALQSGIRNALQHFTAESKLWRHTEGGRGRDIQNTKSFNTFIRCRYTLEILLKLAKDLWPHFDPINQEIKEAAKTCARISISEQAWDEVETTTEFFKLYEDPEWKQEIKQYAIATLLINPKPLGDPPSLARNKTRDRWRSFESQPIQRSPQTKAEIEEKMIEFIAHESAVNMNNLCYLLALYGLTEDKEIQAAAEKGAIIRASGFVKISDPNSHTSIMNLQRERQMEAVTDMAEVFRWPPKQQQHITLQAIARKISYPECLIYRDWQSLSESIENAPEEITPYLPHLSPWIRSIIEIKPLGIKTLKDLARIEHHPLIQPLINIARKTPDEPIHLTAADIKLCHKKLHITYSEAEQIKRSSSLLRGDCEPRNPEGTFNLQTIVDPRTTVSLLCRHCTPWNSPGTFFDEFHKAAKVFGTKRMLQYRMKIDANAETVFHDIQKILDLYQVSALHPNTFYQNILHQVAMDTSEYSEGKAHQHLKAIGESFKPNIKETLELAKQFPHIKGLQKYAEGFSTTADVFASWQTLKRYAQLCDLLGRTEAIKKIAKMRQDGESEALCTYFETIAFHTQSKVNMQAAAEMMLEPERFFEREASHTPEETHDRKKPSNYYHIPHLDLTATELRDALVEGEYDTLQTIRPLKITYTFRLRKGKQVSPKDEIQYAMGTQPHLAAAKNRKKLFVQLNNICKKHNTTLKDYLEAETLQPQLQQELLQTLYTSPHGITPPQTFTLTAQTHKKSDPQAIVIINDVNDCMPFGDGKSTTYAFNPNTTNFTITLENGTSRTICQSVISKGKDIKKNPQPSNSGS